MLLSFQHLVENLQESFWGGCTGRRGWRGSNFWRRTPNGSNQGFNDAKNRYGLEHLCHHHPNSLLVVWLLTLLAMGIERLYRLRHLHRGPHPLRAVIELLRLLRRAVFSAPLPDTR